MDVQVETNKLYKSMERFARETGQELKDVFEDQMRLASNDLVRWMPPKSKTQGVNAVEVGLGNVFTEYDSFVLESWESVGPVPATVIRTKRGAIIAVDAAHYNIEENQGRMIQQHQKNRLKSNGRVTKAGSYGREIGRWKSINRQLVPTGAIKRYRKKHVDHKIGMLKAGWILPEKTGLKTRAPAWVQRAGSSFRNLSEYSDQMDMFASGFLKLTNKVRHVARHGRLISLAVRKRNAALNRFAGRTLDRMIDKFNAGRV